MANTEFSTSFVKGTGGGAIGTDAAPTVSTDAHVVSPEARFQFPAALWLFAVATGAPTVTVYIWDKAVSAWLPLVSATVVALTAPTKVPVPDGARLYIRVTADGGCTQLVGGFAAA